MIVLDKEEHEMLDASFVNSENFKKYYKALVVNFGNANCTGCNALAYILSEYNLAQSNLQDLYKKYGEQLSLTPSAVERSVRVYLKNILRDYTLDDLSEMLNYKFKAGVQTLQATEFVPIFKFKIDNE